MEGDGERRNWGKGEMGRRVGRRWRQGMGIEGDGGQWGRRGRRVEGRETGGGWEEMGGLGTGGVTKCRKRQDGGQGWGVDGWVGETTGEDGEQREGEMGDRGRGIQRRGVMGKGERHGRDRVGGGKGKMRTTPTKEERWGMGGEGGHKGEMRGRADGVQGEGGRWRRMREGEMGRGKMGEGDGDGEMGKERADWDMGVREGEGAWEIGGEEDRRGDKGMT